MSRVGKRGFRAEDGSQRQRKPGENASLVVHVARDGQSRRWDGAKAGVRWTFACRGIGRAGLLASLASTRGEQAFFSQISFDIDYFRQIPLEVDAFLSLEGARGVFPQSSRGLGESTPTFS